MTKLIIGITGPMATGKGTAAQYFKEKHGAVVFRFSSSLFSIAELLGLPADRDHLSRISRVLRTEFGEDLLARALAVQVEKSDASLIIVDGVRRPDDLTALKKQDGFKLIYIDTPIATRFVRMKMRGEKSDDQSKTMEQFTEDHKLETELLIAGLQAYSDVTIDNSGTMKQLDEQLEQLLH